MNRIFFTTFLATLIFSIVCVKAQVPVFEWANKIGSGVGGNDEGKVVKIDPAGNSIIAGTFYGALDMDPSTANYNLQSYASSQDFFIAKYSVSGNLIWAKSIGGLYTEQINSMTLDTLGNIYVAGTFSGTVDFDPSLSSNNLNAAVQQIFFAKYDSNGNFVWVHKLNTNSNNQFINCINADKNNNIIITGQFSGTMDFDPSPSTATLSSFGGSWDVFLAKYDNSGNHIWSKNFGLINSENGVSLKNDNTGNIYLTGTFNGTINLSPAPGSYTASGAGLTDIFFSKFDASGNFIWGKTIGGSNNELCNELAIDKNKNIIITGLYYGAGDYDPSASIANLSWAGSSDLFIAKYDSVGNYLWAKGISGANAESGKAAIADTAGNIYFTGYFEGSVDFDPSPSTALLSSISLTKDVFVAKFNSSGNYLFAKGFGNNDAEEGNSIALDNSLNVTLTGYFNKTVDFDPSPSSYTLTTLDPINNWTNGSFYVSKYTSGTGSFVTAFASYDDYGGVDRGNCIKKDGLGNIYVCGTFQGVVDMDPSLNTFYLKTNGFQDGFIAKYSATGAFVWAKKIGSKNSEEAKWVTVDNAGNCYVTGYFQDTCSFDQSNPSATLTTAGGDDVYVVKYNSTGNYLWAISMGGASSDRGLTITYDNASALFVSGIYSGTADLDPTPVVLSTLSAGLYDIFITKLDLNGNYIFSNHIGGSGDDIPACINMDNVGNVLLTGNFANWADFDPGPSLVSLTSQGVEDIFFAKYDPNGFFYWAKRAGGASTDVSNYIKADNNNNYIITGTFMSTADFDPSFGTYNLFSSGQADAFIGKYNQNGGLIWANNTIAGSGNCSSSALDIDNNGNIFVTGHFAGTADFNPGFTTNQMTGTAFDTFLAKYDSTGNYQWAIQAGGTDNDCAYSITLDNNAIYTTGYFKKEVDFNSAAGISNLSSTGVEDVYILKQKECTPVTVSATQNNITCFGGNNGSATLSATGGTTFTYSWTPVSSTSSVVTNLTPGIYYGTVFNSCGASFTSTITITQPSSITANISQASSTVCSGNNTWFFVTANGGTSPLSYSWSTGATTPNMNINPISSALYTVLVSDANNCTKTLTAGISVINNPTVSIAASSPTLCSGTSVTLNSSGANTYTWSTGAVSSTIAISPSVTSTFSVTGKDSNGCTDTETISVSVSPAPALIVQSTPNFICSGNSATLIVSGAQSYTWSSGSNTNSLAIIPPITSYTVTGVNSLGCEKTITVTPIVYPIPTINVTSTSSVLCVGASATLNASGANSYTWSNGSNNNFAIVSPTISTSYTVDGVSSFGCSGTTLFSQSVTVCTSIDQSTESELNINVFPNPNNGLFTVTTPNYENTLNIKITNLLGQIVYNDIITSERTEINLQNYCKGIYIIKILFKNNTIYTSKVVVD